MKKTFMLFSVCAVMLMACSSEKENKTVEEAFPITSPIVVDTIYTNEYVADIQSLQNVEIRARIKGYVEKINVDEGTFVKSGQVLFILNSQEYEVDLLKAQAMVKAAEVDLQNVKTLVEKNVVSKTELELAQTKLDEARADESSAVLNLSYAAIKAPFDGMIDRIPYKIGSLIDEGTLLTTISDNRKVYAYFNLSEKEYLDFVSKKNSAKKNDIQLLLANSQIHNYGGCIETFGSKIDKNTGNISFRACFSNPELLLKHGSSGKVQLSNEIKGALIIPQKTTFEIQDKLYVFVVDTNNIVSTRNITVKLVMPHLYIIASGLSAHDKIIYEGIQNVKDGDKINTEFISLQKLISN